MPKFGWIGLALLTLAGCSRPDSDPAAGGLTVGEADRLEQAANRLNARTPSPAAADSLRLEQETRARLTAENR